MLLIYVPRVEPTSVSHVKPKPFFNYLIHNDLVKELVYGDYRNSTCSGTLIF